MSDKWDKLNKELDDALEEEFGSEEPKQESVFENAKSTLRKHLFDNKEKVAKDLEQMREWSNTNKQETLEEAAEEFSKNHSIYPTAQDDTEYGFKHGAKWQAERMYSEDYMKKIAFDFYYDMSHKMGVPEDLINENFDNVNVWFKQFKKK